MIKLWYPLVSYCVMAAAISWGCWLPLVLLGPGHAYGPVRYLHFIGGLGPALSGLACAWLFGGRPALVTMIARTGRWRLALRWHLIAWLSPFALLAVALFVANFAGQGGVSNPLTGNVEFPDLPTPVYWVAVLVFYGFGEEVGWRGFALPVLQSRFSALASTLLLSVIWAAWHLPLFWFSPGLSSLGIGGVLGWYLSLLTGATILTWLINSTRGSILLAAIFHAMMDLGFSPSVSPSTTTLIGAAVTVWGIVLVLIPRTLSGTGKTLLPLKPSH